MPSQTSDEIIEKRESHPVATACLVFAALAILASILLQVLEIHHVRAGFNATERNKGEVSQTETELAGLESRVDNLLASARIAPADRATNDELKKRFEDEDAAGGAATPPSDEDETSPPADSGAATPDEDAPTDDDAFFGDENGDL